MGRNNRPPRPSKMAGKSSPRPKTLPINKPDPCSVPCSSQDSAAAAESYMYYNDDTCSDSATDFGSFIDEDDAEFSKLCLPMYSPKSLQFWEDCLSEDEWVGCQSSGTDWVSFETSCGGATAPASCKNSVSLESHMNEEDPVDSSPQPLHQDGNGEFSDHAAKCKSSEIGNSCKETSVNNDEASRPDASVNPRNICNSIEMDYNEETSQPVSRPSSSAGVQGISLEPHSSHVKFKVMSFTVPEFFVEVPETASVGFLKKAILEKATAMVGCQLDVLQVENTGDENEIFPKTSISHQNKLDVMLQPEYLPNLNGSSPNLSCIQLPPQPQTWCIPSSSVVHQGTTDTSPDSSMSILGTTSQDNHEMLEMRTNVPIANSINSMAAQRMIYGHDHGGAPNHTTAVLHPKVTLPSTEPLDSLFLSPSSSSFPGSKSIVSFEDVNDGKRFKRPFFCSFDDYNNVDEEYGEYFHQSDKNGRLTTDQVRLLEMSFEIDIKLKPKRKIQLAKALGLRPRQVEIWFQKRRALWKSKQLEKDYHVLQSSYNNLKADYEGLLKEKERLKPEKAILEKATAMVGGGGQLDVLQVENTRDENENFLKTSISHQNKLDVILQPEYLPNLNGSSPDLSCIQLPPQPQTWCTPSSSVVHQGTTDTSPDSFMNILGTTFQDDHELLEMQTNVPIGNSINSMAAITCSEVNGSLDLVPKCQKIKASKCKKHPVMDENTLDVGHVHPKPNLSKNLKRRKTEFFSISEVEALVQKVEELGTGRWQKIKEQAFGHDSRRTYMDVKDKWRSLVKTAKMSVDKRRGEKLRQELLDKVLAIETRFSQCRDIQK